MNTKKCIWMWKKKKAEPIKIYSNKSEKDDRMKILESSRQIKIKAHVFSLP